MYVARLLGWAWLAFAWELVFAVVRVGRQWTGVCVCVVLPRWWDVGVDVLWKEGSS